MTQSATKSLNHQPHSQASPSPQRPPMRFLLDGMLGKLTRWLRMLGYDASYPKDSSDAELLAAAEADSLILLTADEELYRTASFRGIQSFLVRGKTEPERLAELAERYKLTLEIDANNSRCPNCGYPIKETGKEQLSSLIPAATFKVYKTFWVCTNPSCSKIYWQGSHWSKIEQTLQAAKRIRDLKSNPSNR